MVSPMKDVFHRDVAEKYEPDTDITCAICGYGIYRGERVSRDKHDEICHAECVEEDGYGAKSYIGYRYR